MFNTTTDFTTLPWLTGVLGKVHAIERKPVVSHAAQAAALGDAGQEIAKQLSLSIPDETVVFLADGDTWAIQCSGGDTRQVAAARAVLDQIYQRNLNRLGRLGLPTNQTGQYRNGTAVRNTTIALDMQQ